MDPVDSTSQLPATPSALTPPPDATATVADRAVAAAVPPAPLPVETAAEVSASGGLMDMLILGGPVVWILLVMSTVALAVMLLKLWQFHTTGVDSRRHEQALTLWRGGQPAAAAEAAGADTKPLPRLLHMAMSEMRAGPGRVNVELLREELSRRAVATLEDLRSHLRALEVIAALAPLLGLFGTVLGMIAAFQAMETAGSQVDPSVLSGGIWEALLTTAVGLAVAMPTVMVHSWLERRVDRYRHRIEDALTQVFTHPVESEEQIAGRLLQFEKRHAPA